METCVLIQFPVDVSAVVTDNFLVFSFLEKSKLFYIYMNKKQSGDFKKLEKLSALEPKVIHSMKMSNKTNT